MTTDSKAGTAERVIQRLENANAGGFFHCEADREEAIEIVAEEISAALASTAGAAAGDPVAEACKPWRFGAGGLPSDDSPLIGPYSAGIGYAIDMLAKITNAGEYVGADGSETFEGDVRGTIMNVLRAAKLYDDEDGRFATLSTVGAAAGDWVTVPREPTHDMLVAGYTAYAEAEWDAGRAKRGPERDSLPIAFRAMLAKAPAVSASPRSGAGEGGKVRSRLEAEGWSQASVVSGYWDKSRPDNAFVCVVNRDLRLLDEATHKLASPPAPAEHGTKIDGKLYANVSTQPFQCPHCDCRSYARVSERKGDNDYRPGLLIRCVECKAVYRDANAVEFPLPAPAERGVEIREAMVQVIEAARRMPRETPATGGAGTIHRFQIEAGVVWSLDRALTLLDRALSQGGGAGRSERAVEIRELFAEIIHDHSHREQGILSWAELRKQNWLNGIAAQKARALADKLIAALHRSEIAGRSEKGAGDEVAGYLNLYRADDGSIEAGCTDLYENIQEARDFAANDFCEHLGVFAVVRVTDAPAQSPSTSDAEG